jgi:hypothetical protein
MARKDLTKEELKNIINKDWDKRRENNKKRKVLNSKRTKEWKTRENQKLNNKKRKKHFLEPSLKTTVPSSSRTTLSLLVAVTYAPED